MKQAKELDRLLFFATPPHECSYLPGREATTVFADPGYPKDAWLYTVLSENGFRRSGQHIYRPRCQSCAACIPVRVAANEFKPRRRQRRTSKKNRDLTVVRRVDEFREDHFTLYQRYLTTRHPGGGMDDPSPRQYMDFLTSPWSETMFVEFRKDEELLALAVADRLVDGLSAVYTFFDPDSSWRSLGALAILWQISEVKRLGLSWLYLGYWIDGSPKMAYKSEYHPIEQYRGGRWVRPEPN